CYGRLRRGVIFRSCVGVTLVSNISDVQSVTCQISRGRVAVATGPDGTGTPASWDDARSMFDKCEFVHSPTVRSAVLYGVSASPNDARGQVAAGHSVVPPCRGEDGECSFWMAFSELTASWR